MNEKILVVDDEESIRYTFTSLLSNAGYQVATSETLSDAMEIIGREMFDLIYLDIAVGLENGLDALREVKKQPPACPIVMITGTPNPKTIVQAIKSGASDYLAKPIRPPSLLYITQKVLAANTANPQGVAP